jgi:hypothetical protein
MQAMVAAPQHPVYDDSWYPGATNHLTPDINNLSNKTEYNGQEQIHAGNGNTIGITQVWFLSY